MFDRAIDRMGSVVGDVSRKSSVALGRLFSDVFLVHLEVSPSIFFRLHLDKDGWLSILTY